MNATTKAREVEVAPVAAEVPAIIERATALSVLTDSEKFDAFYEKVRAETDAFVPDVTSDKGRKAIAAMAFKVTKTKTAIDAAGKQLTEEWRTQTAKVDASRKAIRDKLDALRDEVRKPLTEWEEAEEQRVKDVDLRLKQIEHAATVWPDDTAKTVGARLAEMENLELDPRLFQENLPLATSAREHAAITLRSMHARLVQEEADRAELSRLRAEAEERARREAEEEAERQRAEAAAVAARLAKEAEERRIADEAAAAERARAEEEARLERERVAREEAAKAAAEAAQRETERKAQEALEAAEVAHRAEVERLEKEARERAAAAEAAERARAEEARLAAEEAEAQRKADEARAADRAHRGEIMGAVKADIMEASGITEEQAKVIVLAIAGGNIRHTSLRF